MTLLDRFRTQARDKHPDPAVRLAFVGEIALDDRATIIAMAREDEDPRVRRAAVAKLMVPSALAAVARDDRDEGVRTQASTMLRDIALEAFVDIGEAESLEAVEEIADPRMLAQVAKGAVREIVALRALSRIEDPHVLGSVARHAAVEAARTRAVESLRSRGEHGELIAVAMNSDFKDTALLAVDSISDRGELELIIARGKNKSAAKRARTILREADEQAAREAAEATAALIAAHPAIPEPEAETASPPHGDPLAAQLASDEERQAEANARVALDAEQAAERARADALVEAEAREALALETARRHARLAELATEAAQAAGETDLTSARKRFSLVAREWRALAAGITVEPDLSAGFAESDARISARDQEAREADALTRREALGRVHGLLGRLETLAGRPDATLKAVDRGLRDVRAALGSVPPLPTKQDFDEVTRRLKAVQTALVPKLQELREADEWRRFANTSIQEQLCAKMEALRTAEDPDAIAHQVHELQQQWREAADVPRAQADQLWRRFKAAHDDVWSKCEAYFAAQAQVRTENLAKKVALCEKVEALSDSTRWIQTAEEIKALQAEWKTIGPVSRGKEKASWDRFRAACDRFFIRRHEDLTQRKAAWTENLAKKDALCVRAEATAESSDWDAAAAEIKKLQAEWRTIGPVKKTKSDAVWQRFRAACDRFFARYAARHDAARAERIAAREAICAELEAQATGEEAPPDLPAALRASRIRWQQEIGARGVDPDRARALDQRFAAAFDGVIARWPAALAGSELDPEANLRSMESLVRRVEGLASSLAGPAEGDAALSPTTRLAAMLKEALAANTIGGKVDEEARIRAAAEEARQAQAAWTRIGIVPDEARRRLTDRFQRAIRAISDKGTRVSGTQAPRPGSAPPRGGRQ